MGQGPFLVKCAGLKILFEPSKKSITAFLLPHVAPRPPPAPPQCKVVPIALNENVTETTCLASVTLMVEFQGSDSIIVFTFHFEILYPALFAAVGPILGQRNQGNCTRAHDLELFAPPSISGVMELLRPPFYTS